MKSKSLRKASNAYYLLLVLLVPVDSMSADLDSLLVQKQQEVVSQNQSEEDDYATKQRLRTSLYQAFNPIVRDIYGEMKEAGVKFDDAAALYERLKVNLSSRFSLSDLEGLDGNEFIKFLSYSFLVSTRYNGAFTLEGTDRLFAIYQDYVWDSDPCVAVVSVEAYYLSSGFNEGGAYRREYRHSCDDILSGQNIDQLKGDIKTGILEMME